MSITREQYKRIESLFPKQRGNVQVDNQTFLNALLYMLENGSKWRSLPPSYGKWSTIYKRHRRWRQNGVLERVQAKLLEERLIEADVSVMSLDSTCIKASLSALGALKKRTTGHR
ncbi:MAG: transposase [Thermoguttaceae bacterium]|nr:transposase [Thermoguttaceae bacterium]